MLAALLILWHGCLSGVPHKHSVLTWVLLQAVRTSGDVNINQHCQPWIGKLLLSTRHLTALSVPVGALPCSPILQHLPLQHLELVVSDITQQRLGQLLDDVSRCHTLEVLRVIGDKLEVVSGSKRLPSMHLQSMPSLKHVRLEDCLPVDELSLPADCSLFLDVSCRDDEEWLEHLSKFEAHARVLRLSTSSYEEWLPGIVRFSHLQGLELCLKGSEGLDLADLRHIPHVKLVLRNSQELCLTAGSWESLEVLHLGELYLAISDVNSFVRDTRSFTIMSESWDGEPSLLLRKEIAAACQRLGKACHVCKHHGMQYGDQLTYVTLSTSQEVAMHCPVNLNQDQDEDSPIYEPSEFQHMLGQSLFDLHDFWPCDPWSPMKWRGDL